MPAPNSNRSGSPPRLVNFAVMRKLLPLLALVFTACSPGDAGDATTSLPGFTTSSIASTTTEVPTTISVPVSTSSSPGTSTTTLATTTTTEPGGNWADQPLITTGFGALGWWDGGIWVPSKDVGALPIVGGEDYQIAVIGLQATTTGGSQDLRCEPLNNLGVQLDNEHLLGEFPGPYGVAISAPWTLQPHLFEAFNDDGTYASIASGLLADRGLNVPKPVIKQLFRTDLEGDGTNEVLVVAEDISGGFLPAAGEYSIVFLQKVVQSDVQTAVLGATAITDPESQFVEAFTIGAVADLSDDDKMEIVLNSAFFEGFGVAVWEYVNDDIGPKLQIQAGCGS